MLRFIPESRRDAFSVGSARFARDVLASVLAAGIGAVAFSHLSHDSARPMQDLAHSKTFDRLTWEVEDVPTRMTRTYDALAMFALPIAEPAPWREQGALSGAPQPGAPIKLARAERPERDPHRTVLPPSRPMPAKVVPEGSSGRLTVLGWQVPGTDRIPSLLPDGGEVVRHAAQVGSKVTGMGQELAAAIGLK
ncbi:MAG: hypothetical protein JWQ36_2802 [Enterovirga sp.]|nr:hypothetical protein [Enterovirga sp.]